jgi:UTP-glucose-1-phosphate uridylyltransferase
MTLLIMAAGMGSRYGGIKQIEPVGEFGELIIDYSIHDAIAAGFTRVVFVIRRDIKRDFKRAIFNRIRKKIKARFVYQSIPKTRGKPWGTGHAVIAARKVINEPFCVISADDFYGAEAFHKMADFLRNLKPTAQNDYAIMTAKLDTMVSDHGSVSRGICLVDKYDFVTEINERTKVIKKDSQIGYTLDGNDFYPLNPKADVNVSFFGFTPNIFNLLQTRFEQVLTTMEDPKTAEFQLTTEISNLIQNKTITLKKLSTRDKWLGFTYPQDKIIVQNEIKQLIKSGVYQTPLWSKKCHCEK